MRVIVTGGTGYVGGHVVASLVRAGHEVRMLVRRPDQVARTLDPLGVAVTDVHTGDVLDAEAVDRALVGCDAVVHAAAVFSLDPRRAEEMTRTNCRAAELVVGGAVARGLDPVVHISSTVALTRHGGSAPDLPLGDVDLPYAASKRASEELVRGYQASGAPVVSVYPGGVLGPHDPYTGTQAEILRWLARGLLPAWPRGGMLYVDVRDVAAVVLACLEPGQGPRRYVVPGHHVGGQELFSALRRVTGRRLPAVLLPAGVARSFARATEALNRRLPDRMHLPTDLEGVELLARDTRFDTTPATDELGVVARPFDESLADTLRWLAQSGQLPRRYLGRLAAPA